MGKLSEPMSVNSGVLHSAVAGSAFRYVFCSMDHAFRRFAVNPLEDSGVIKLIGKTDLRRNVFQPLSALQKRERLFHANAEQSIEQRFAGFLPVAMGEPGLADSERPCNHFYRDLSFEILFQIFFHPVA